MVERSPEIFENEEKATTIEIKTVTPSIIYSVGLAASVRSGRWRLRWLGFFSAVRTNDVQCTATLVQRTSHHLGNREKDFRG